MSKEWFLVTWTTYGTWLPGDPRGFRTRNAREYVPPPARYAKADERVYDPDAFSSRHTQAQVDLEKPPVRLNRGQQQFVADDLYDQLVKDGERAFLLSVEATHVHVLAEFEAKTVKREAGRYKGRLSNRLSKQFPDLAGRVWSGGSHAEPKRTRQQVRGAAEYIRRHIHQGAVVREYKKGQGGGAAPTRP
jgi:hypothetical protein